MRLVASVGADALADEALALLKAEGVNLGGCIAGAGVSTGVALIAVSADGENQIIVAPGANAVLTPDLLGGPIEGALICQLELPVATVAKAVAMATGLVCVNLAPAAEVPDAVLARADLIVVNEAEAAFYGPRLLSRDKLTAVTWGARGAGLYRAGAMIAEAAPPKVTAVDSTGAGDAFVAALTLALLEGRPHERALAFACATGALTATRAGAQPSLPTRAEVEALLNRG